MSVLLLGAAACSHPEAEPAFAFSDEWSGAVPNAGFITGVAAVDGGFVALAESYPQNGAAQIVRMDRAGHAAWTLSGAFAGLGAALVADPAGRLFLAGSLQQPTTVGTAHLSAPSYPAQFVMALDATSGAVSWAKSYSAGGFAYGAHLAADAHGVVIAGQFGGTLLVDGKTLTGGSTYVMRLAADGKLVSVRALGSSSLGSLQVGGLALSPDGDLFLTGSFYGIANFGDGPRASSPGGSVYLVRLAPDGSLRWARHYAGSASFEAQFFGGGIALYGAAQAVDLGAGVPLQGAVLAELHGDGSYQWSHTLKDTHMYSYGFNGVAHGEVLDASGHLVIFNARRVPVELPTPEMPYPSSYVTERRLLAVDADGSAAASLDLGTLPSGTTPLIMPLAAGADGAIVMGLNEESYDPQNGGPPVLTSRVRTVRLVPSAN